MVERGNWRVVVPVKGGGEAKTRLRLPADARRTLATAMALDCLDTCLATPEVALVVCVSDDPAIAAAAREIGAATVSAGRPGLSVAIEAGLATLAGGPSAVLVADLPALRVEDLSRALREAASRPGPVLVADADGGGSVLVADRDGAPPHHFGAGSAAAHRAAGARALTGALPGLRHDVDTLDALTAAVVLGVGPRTRAVLAEPSLALPRPSSELRRTAP